MQHAPAKRPQCMDRHATCQALWHSSHKPKLFASYEGVEPAPLRRSIGIGFQYLQQPRLLLYFVQNDRGFSGS